MNLGSPRSCTIKDVREYLSEFLMDPYVIDIPYIQRWLLVHGIILRTRPKNSAHAYEKIWTKDGSPLVFHTSEAAKQLQQSLGSNYFVRWAMRYGNHKPVEAIREFKAQGISKILFIPMYPQYSLAATETAAELFRSTIATEYPEATVVEIQDFYKDPEFISAWASLLRPALTEKNPDLLLLTYHGLPERQITKIPGCGSTCRFGDCCLSPAPEALEKCYRAQCYQTSLALARELNWPWEKVFVSFQSRLGRTPWIKPYTDIVLPDLVSRGARNIVVASPSFTADCLETLEEINMRLREQFTECGGVDFTYVPCLNSDSVWIDGLGKMCTRTANFA